MTPVTLSEKQTASLFTSGSRTGPLPFHPLLLLMLRLADWKIHADKHTPSRAKHMKHQNTPISVCLSVSADCPWSAPTFVMDVCMYTWI